MTQEEALAKLQRYCAYQDRCHQEVRTKLLSLKIYGDWLEEIIARLIEDDFLNEERYARSYVRGKYRIKKWGKRKILNELKLRRISPYCIKKGMTEIDPLEYRDNLYSLMEKYVRERQGKYPKPQLTKKVIQHAMTKGYDYAEINDQLKSINFD